MKRIILFILLMATVLAPAEKDLKKAVTEKDLKSIADDIVGSPVGGLVSGEAVNIYIDDDTYHLVVEDKKVTDVGEGLLDEPTINAYTSTETVNKLLAGDMTIVEALENKDITYEGVGVFNSVKSGLSKVIMKVILWFN